MQIHTIGQQPLPTFKKAVVTIGSFDGVHQGHRQILAQMREVASSIGGETVIITFYPHPRKVISSIPGEVKLLTTLSEKTTLLSEAGINHLVVVPFHHQFAQLSAEDFVQEFLYAHFHPHTLIIGYDHRFGKGRLGDYHLLEKMGASLGFRVMEIDGQMLQASAISSTRIRQAILSHQVAEATALLGYPYFFEGVVMEGNQLGRTIGFPTANLQITEEDKLIPSDGVYVVSVALKSHSKQIILQKGGMMNIGIRPTVNGKSRVIEVHIFDFDETIYQQTIQVKLLHFLRDEVKFNTVEELKNQLSVDRQRAVSWLQEQHTL
jgi:riboflavin kinase/FMN adenylyltransferase